MKSRRPLAEALIHAHELARRMAPACERLEIAGSIRRAAPEVGDIELVVIPRWREVEAPGPRPLFGPPALERRNDLVALLRDLIGEGALTALKMSTSDEVVVPAADLRDDAKAMKFRHRSGMQVDLFICTPETWGLNFFIRTGPGDFGRRALAHWKRITGGGYADEAQLYNAAGKLVPTPEEADVFSALKVGWIEPARRR